MDTDTADMTKLMESIVRSRSGSHLIVFNKDYTILGQQILPEDLLNVCSVEEMFRN